MLIFWKERLVFLSNTKSGSTSVGAALEPLAQVSIQRPPALKHTDAARYHSFVAPLLESAAGATFQTVALMREPISWLGSWYRDRQHEAHFDDDGDGGASSTGSGTGTSRLAQSFTQYAEEAMAPRATGMPPHRRQIGFFTGRTDALSHGGPGGAETVHPKIDFIFRYEDIGSFVHFLEDRLDCAITLPRLNVSPAGATDLAEATAARLHSYLAPEYGLYGRLRSDGHVG